MSLQLITSVIQTYFDGLYEGDPVKLGGVFHNSSCLYFESQGGLRVESVTAWLERVGGRPTPQSQGLARLDEIVSVTLSSPSTAQAQVNCLLPPARYTDCLSLARIDGRWQIIAKVYSATPYPG